MKKERFVDYFKENDEEKIVKGQSLISTEERQNKLNQKILT